TPAELLVLLDQEDLVRGSAAAQQLHRKKRTAESGTDDGNAFAGLNHYGLHPGRPMGSRRTPPMPHRGFVASTGLPAMGSSARFGSGIRHALRFPNAAKSMRVIEAGRYDRAVAFATRRRFGAMSAGMPERAISARFAVDRASSRSHCWKSWTLRDT